MDLFTQVIAVVSMPGIAVVGAVPGAIGAGMAALLLMGLVEHARGNVPDFSKSPKASKD